MAGVPPCRCDGPNAACRRAGRPMTVPLWGLCSGTACGAETAAMYRELWDRLYAGRAAVAPPAPAGPCRFLGGPTGDTVACPTCRGRVMLKVFACAVHGRCTLAANGGAMAACPCPQYEPSPATTEGECHAAEEG
jgi:hypothetical protein